MISNQINSFDFVAKLDQFNADFPCNSHNLDIKSQIALNSFAKDIKNENLKNFFDTFYSKSISKINQNIELIMPEAEVDKFITMMNDAFAKGTVLSLGETHGEQGVYDLFLHPKVQKAMLELKKMYEKKGEGFISHIFLELPPSGSIERFAPHKIKTLQDLLDNFNAKKDPDTIKLLARVLSASTAFHPPGFIERRISVYQFLVYELGAKLKASDSGFQRVQEQDAAKKGQISLETQIKYRNSKEANFIYSTMQNNPKKSRALAINGMMHLYNAPSNKSDRKYISIESKLDSLAGDKNYSTSIILRPNPLHEVEAKEATSYHEYLNSIKQEELTPIDEVWVDNYAPQFNIEDFFKNRARLLFSATYGKDSEFLKKPKSITNDSYRLAIKVMDLISQDLFILKHNDPTIKAFLSSQNSDEFQEHYYGAIDVIGRTIIMHEFALKFGIDSKMFSYLDASDPLYKDALRDLRNAIPQSNFSKLSTNYGFSPR